MICFWAFVVRISILFLGNSVDVFMPKAYCHVAVMTTAKMVTSR